MPTIDDCVKLRPDFKIQEQPLSLRATWSHRGLPYELIGTGEARTFLIDICHREMVALDELQERKPLLDANHVLCTCPGASELRSKIRKERDDAIDALHSACMRLEAASYVLNPDIANTYKGDVKVKEYAEGLLAKANEGRAIAKRIREEGTA